MQVAEAYIYKKISRLSSSVLTGYLVVGLAQFAGSDKGSIRTVIRICPGHSDAKYQRHRYCDSCRQG